MRVVSSIIAPQDSLLADSRGRLRRPACLAIWSMLLGSTAAFALELRLPIACEIGRSCAIQNYVDRDPGTGAEDYTCGTRTYDGHKGTDFRLPTLAAQRAGVAVLAAAEGRVLRRRDGVADVSVREIGREAVSGTECGNGIVLDHSDGWETQYCHMARGSILVRAGERVSAGQPIGAVGLSGATEYPHLHFTVRRNGEIVDPFAFEAPTCGMGRSLWTAEAQATLGYRARVVLNAGFSTVPVTNEMVEAGDAAPPAPTRYSPALVAYVRVIGAKTGDVQELTLRGPDGRIVAENTSMPLERDQPQARMFVGRKVRGDGWPAGRYDASYTVTNAGVVVLEHSLHLDLK
jgi:murein DD-endopeptidase MepM/ murein hydrolase activator NlpD